MRKFKTRNGTIETEEELRSFYGEEFDRRLRNGDFTQVEDDAEAGQSVQNFERQEGEDSGVSDEIFITPNGSEETGDELIKFYGIDKFNDLQSSGDLKKKANREMVVEIHLNQNRETSNYWTLRLLKSLKKKNLVKKIILQEDLVMP